MLEAADVVCVIAVGPSVAHPACDRSPEIHSPREGDGRVGVACRKGVFGHGAHKSGNIVCRLAHELCCWIACR